MIILQNLHLHEAKSTLWLGLHSLFGPGLPFDRFGNELVNPIQFVSYFIEGGCQTESSPPAPVTSPMDKDNTGCIATLLLTGWLPCKWHHGHDAMDGQLHR